MNTLCACHSMEDMCWVAIGYGNETFAHRPTGNIINALLIGINECPNNQKSHLSPILSPNINDCYLMNDFAKQDFLTHKLVKLNACQMYLQVTTLAKITDHTGKELLPQLFLDHASLYPKGLTNISTSKLQWPHMALPTPTCWHIWTAMIRSLYTGSRTGTHLQHLLSMWTTNYDVYQFWHWWQFDLTHLLFQQTINMRP